MSIFALIALAAYALVTFGWRAWLQKRWTGDAGLRGAPRTPAEWVAGVPLVLGTIAVYAAPALDLTGSLTPLTTLERPLLWIGGAIPAAIKP